MGLDELRDALVNQSLMITVLGARGSGKTAASLWLAEHIAKKGRPVAVYRPPLDLPFEKIEKIKDLENKKGYFVVIDEGAISLNARESMSLRNRILGKLFAITRHKDLSILFITQVSALIDVNILRYADVLFVKRPSRFQAEFERQQLRDYLSVIRQTIDTYTRELGVDYRSLAWVDSDWYEGIIQTGLPSFWSEGVSKAFGGIPLQVASEERATARPVVGPVDEERVVQLYQQLGSIRKVAEATGLTRYKVYEILKMHNAIKRREHVLEVLEVKVP